MHRPLTARVVPFWLALLAAFPAAAQTRPTLVPADYGRWETLGATVLSPDGRWLAWTVSRIDGDVALHWRAVPDGARVDVPHGSSPVFSPDGRWLAYSVGISNAERARREQAGELVRQRLVLVDLSRNEEHDAGEMASAQFSADGTHVLLRGYVSEGPGTDIVVRSLRTGAETRHAGVTAHRWSPRGASLVLVLRDSAGFSLRLHDHLRSASRVLATDTAELLNPAWRNDADDLVVFRRIRDARYEAPTHALLLWRNVTSVSARAEVMDPATAPGFPAGARVTDFREVQFSRDGATLYFGFRDWTARPDTAVGDTIVETPAGVEVWHSLDAEIIPEQKVRANLDASRSGWAAWHPAQRRVVRIGGTELENVLLSDGPYALGLDAEPWRTQRMFGPALRDMIVIDTRDGTRTVAARGVQHQYGISPGGRWLLFVREGHFRTHDTHTGAQHNITQGVPARFINDEHDYALPEKPPYGFAGWLPGDEAVLLHDRYDIWEVRADGSGAVRLTDGAAERIRHRRLWLTPDDRVVDPEQLFAGLYGETTKRTGFARIRRGRSAEPLVWIDALTSRLAKAERADVYMYRVERFDDSPDIFVGSARLSDARQVTRTNPFAAEYAWGRAELVDFTSTAGRRLQGALFHPADYQPGRTYPMIVDVYETLSNTVHTWSAPSAHAMHNTTVFTQNGYFVLKPDIAYRLRDPGVSAVEAIVPAVQAVLRRGIVDPERVALIGHSWGAYQTAFTITQTDLFRAAVAAAPIANMFSMYLSVYWNTGGTDARMFEVDQGRMEVPFWEDHDAYVRNSPVFHIESMNTPLLVAFGDRDGAVDWHQGIELYNAARRAGKPLVLLVYEGENHSLARRPNQVDYHRRVNEWLAHHLKGEPPADWIVNGVRHADRQRELQRIRSMQNRNREGAVR